MNINTILNVVYAVASAIAVAVPLVIALVVNIKKKIEINKELANTSDEVVRAKLEALSAQSTTAMMDACNTLIANAETLYADVAALLKSQGKSAGVVKKDSVMSKLQAYALENGYKFDAEFWSNKIDEIVTLTRTVNAK